MTREAKAAAESAAVAVANPFSGASAVVVPETASASAITQREIAQVQGQVYAAKQFPRDQVRAMERILTACGRITLAEEAMYQYARGGTDIEGPSIRLLEAIAQQWGNIDSGTVELERRAGQSEMLAYAVDLESNVRDSKRWIVKHWRDTKTGGYVLRDERDIYEATANQAARRKRACLLAVIPVDVVDAAVEQCKETLKTKVEITPKRIASLAKKFSDEFGIGTDLLEKRLQRRLDTITPAQMVQLSRVYNSLRDGMSVASDWFETPEAPPAQETPQAGVEGAKAALKARKEAQAQQEQEPELPIADERAHPPQE